MPSRTTVPSAKFCCAGLRSARAAPAKLSRQVVASAATYSLTRPASTVCLARDLTHAGSSACSLPYAGIAEDSCPRFSFIEIIPSLCHVIFVIQLHHQVCIVPVFQRLHSGHARKRKRQTILFQVSDGACDHLRL